MFSRLLLADLGGGVLHLRGTWESWGAGPVLEQLAVSLHCPGSVLFKVDPNQLLTTFNT